MKKASMGLAIGFILLNMAAEAEASATVPDWVYRELELLREKGLIQCDKDLRDCSREELAKLVSDALERMPEAQRREIQRALGEKTEKDTLKHEDKSLERLEKKAQKHQEAYVRACINGNDRLEEMGPLKKKADKSNAEYVEAVKEKAEANRHPQQPESLVEEYGQTAGLLIHEKVELRFAKEQEKTAEKKYKKAKKAVKAQVDTQAAAKADTEKTKKQEAGKKKKLSKEDEAYYRQYDYEQAVKRREKWEVTCESTQRKQEKTWKLLTEAPKDVDTSIQPVVTSGQESSLQELLSSLRKAGMMSAVQALERSEKAKQEAEAAKRKKAQVMTPLVTAKPYHESLPPQEADSHIGKLQKKAEQAQVDFARYTASGENNPQEYEKKRERADHALNRLLDSLRAYALSHKHASQPEALAEEYSQLAGVALYERCELEAARSREYEARKQREAAPESLLKQYSHEETKRRLAQWQKRSDADQKKLEALWKELLTDKNKGVETAEPKKAARPIVREEKQEEWQKGNVLALRAEFIPELSKSGYLDTESAKWQGSTSNQSLKEDWKSDRLRVNGEVRLDAQSSTSEESAHTRSRVRARLYGDYNIDGNWHAKGMLEWEKVLKGTGYSNDGKLKLARYYLEGELFKNVMADIGTFGSNMAEGNIYDSKFQGIRLWTGKPVVYKLEVGTINGVNRAVNLTASYDSSLDGANGWDAGYYRFDDISGAVRNIYMGNLRRPLGPFRFGAMLLHGRDANAGDGTGYVLSLWHGRENSWRKKNASYWLKYYRQPSATYVSHTMNGSADFMSYDATPWNAAKTRGGFRGIGLGYTYTLNHNLLAQVDFYQLQDLHTKVRSHTIWGGLTWYFGK